MKIKLSLEDSQGKRCGRRPGGALVMLYIPVRTRPYVLVERVPMVDGQVVPDVRRSVAARKTGDFADTSGATNPSVGPLPCVGMSMRPVANVEAAGLASVTG